MFLDVYILVLVAFLLFHHYCFISQILRALVKFTACQNSIGPCKNQSHQFIFHIVPSIHRAVQSQLSNVRKMDLLEVTLLLLSFLGTVRY